MRPQSETEPLLDQFLDQNRVSVVSLRDFKKTARDLIEACRIKSNIHPLLADHTFREAERFIEIIDLFEDLKETTPQCFGHCLFIEPLEYQSNNRIRKVYESS